MPINFGTDGWRAVISDTFTFHNLRNVTQAIADAVNSEDWLNGMVIDPAPDPNLMIVGFDTRFLSDRYAREAGARAGSQRFQSAALPGRRANAGSFLYSEKPACHRRHHDHGFPQRAALQRREIKGRLRRLGAAGTMPKSGSLPER